MKTVIAISSWCRPVGKLEKTTVITEGRFSYSPEQAESSQRPGDVFRGVDEINSGRFNRSVPSWEPIQSGKLNWFDR